MPGRRTNNPLGDLDQVRKSRRDPVEDALANLYRVLVDLEEVALRLDQAVLRSQDTATVLHPALDRLAQIRARLGMVRTTLGAYWRDGQVHRWD